MAHRCPPPLLPFGFAPLWSWGFCSGLIILFMLSRVGEGMTTSAPATCLPNQSLALLQFKQSLSPIGSTQKFLRTWQDGSDCCKWEGVSCDLSTGFVTTLDISHLYLEASELPPSLFQLRHLSHLDLCFNSFGGTIPSRLSELTDLTDLHMCGCKFIGPIPESLKQLSNLTTLDLSDNSLSGEVPPGLLHHPTLHKLDLFNNMLNGSLPDLGNGFSTNLYHLDLSDNNLSGEIPPSLLNHHLTYLGLSHNNLIGVVPPSLLNHPTLQELYLSSNHLNGSLPDFENGFSTNLYHLDLSHNKLNGSFPDFGNELSTFRFIDLSYNQLDGKVPSSLNNLRHLEVLRLAGNRFSGTIHLSLFQNLRNLSVLSLSDNQLTVKLPKVVDADQQGAIFSSMEMLELRSCNTEGELLSGKILTHMPLEAISRSGSNNVHVRNNNTREAIPTIVICYMFKLFLLDLSNNNLTGTLPDCLTNLTNLMVVDLNNNQFHGQIPKALICGPHSSLEYVILGNNQLTGETTRFGCNCSSGLAVLDLSHNQLTGRLPDNLFTSFYQLRMMDLSSNQLHGPIPNQLNVSRATFLKVLNLNDNKLEGRIPSSLSNCTQLEIINLARNELSDVFPFWIGHLHQLRVLMLDSNKLYGSMRFSSSKLVFSSLQILSISGNQLMGQFPSLFFSNSSFMMGNQSNIELQDVLYNIFYVERLWLYIKGCQRQLWRRPLRILASIDLSNNHFVGKIPEEIGALQGLCSLNLSWNSLDGFIPRSLGHLYHLESLDLSHNHLTGSIPEELTRDTFLSVLDLSYNSLEGKIPQGNQFQTFNATSFDGNPRLCGPPLATSCPSSNSGSQGYISGVEETTPNAHWEYLLDGVGFAMGLMTVTLPILFSERVGSWYWNRVDSALRF